MNEAAQLEAFCRSQDLGPQFLAQVEILHAPFASLVEAAARSGPAPLVVGVCGPQGSGKSTLADVAALILGARGLRVAVLSLDDLYLPRADRAALAARVHPLLATRGPPGTHDPQLGLQTLDALGLPGRTRLPRFDKAADDRRPASDWEDFEGPADIILFEGWCVGARPQPPSMLIKPVNQLERDEDGQGIWRAYINTALAGPYQALFDRLDRLALLLAPNFETVLAWRSQQEAKLRARVEAPARTMDEAGLVRFLQHYERLTRWIVTEMPQRANWLAQLDIDRRGSWS